MENRAHALAAGLFTLLLGAAMVGVALWFGKDEIRLVPYEVTTTTSVAGLKVEAPVRYRGVEVGKVQSIRIDPGSNGRIHIRIGVAEETPVTKSTFARLGYQGVTGIAYISLDDSGNSAERLKTSSRNVARIAMQRSIVDSGEDLIAALGEIADRVNALLDEDNRDTIRRTLGALEQATQRIASVAQKIEPGVAGLPALIGDARAALGDARGALGDARGVAGRAGQLMDSVGGLALRVEQRVAALDRAAHSVEEVGAAARAVNDETLPRVNALVEELHRETRTVDRLINALGDQPQSLVFGLPPGRPGPGEPGFSSGSGK